MQTDADPIDARRQTQTHVISPVPPAAAAVHLVVSCTAAAAVCAGGSGPCRDVGVCGNCL